MSTSAREVVKTIGTRRYRYRVERVRDETSGRMRARWTYLGRADGPAARAPRPAASDARERLLGALGRLLDVGGDDLPPVSAIAREAGLAHGTFYRHFASKEAALDVLLGETQDALAELGPDVGRPPADRAAARAEIQRWAAAICERGRTRPGLVRASLRRFASDPRRRCVNDARRAAVVAALAAYLAALDRRGFARVSDAPALAAGIVFLLKAAFRAGAETATSDARATDGVLAVVDRAIFGAPPAERA